MSDPNLVEFYKRAARLEQDRARGLGFEATGALGRSHYRRAAPRRRWLLTPALFLVSAAFLMKGAILYATGDELYAARVAELQAAPGVVEQVGGWLMQTEPVTLWLADQIALGVTRVRT